MSAVAEPILLEKIAGTVASTLKIPVDRLDVDADFDSFGMDSIIAIELMTNLSKQLQISITPAQLTAVSSIRQLASAIGDSAPPPVPAFLPTPIRQMAAANAPTIGAPTTSRVAERLVEVDGIHERLQAFVRAEYGLDLRGERFTSREALIEHMVEHHSDALFHYYNLSDSSEPAAFVDMHVSPRDVGVPGIAIVGMACEFADAQTPDELWQNLLSERSSIQPLPSERWQRDGSSDADLRPRWGALIDGVDQFDAAFFGLAENEARMCDPQERRVMQALYHALQNAGIRADKLRGTRTGLFLGYEYAEYEHLLRRNQHRMPGAPVLSSSSPIYYLANRISFLYDFKGPSEVVNASCASSALAIHRAAQALAQGECDLAICGGVSLNLFADDYAAIASYGLLSADGSCAVFDDNANGFTRGEGLGLLVLKRMADAESDKNRIYAKLLATHQNNRGRASFISEIKHEAITQVIRECYEKHSIATGSVRYIEVDGYATKWGDSFEFEGIKNAFPSAGDAGKFCALGSIKGNIGHVEPASGVASTIKVALALHHKRFPPTITKKKLSSFIDIDSKSHPLFIADHVLPFDELRKAGEPIRAAINSFADSGVNVHLVLEEHCVDIAQNGGDQAEAPGASQLFIFSARTRESLLAYLDAYTAYLRTPRPGQTLEALAYSMQVATEPMAHRLALIAAGPKELLDSVARASKLLAGNKSADGSGQIFIGNAQQSDGGRVFEVIQSQIGEDRLLDNLRSRQLKEVALLWTSGIDMPWNRYWHEVVQARGGQAGTSLALVDLPLYPFARTRYWLDFSTKEGLSSDNAVPPDARLATGHSAEPEAQPPKMAGEGQLDAASQDNESLEGLSAHGKICRYLVQETASLLQMPRQDIDEDMNFLVMGFDSVAMTTLIQRITQLLDENISPSVVFNHPDIASLALYLAETYPEKIDRIHAVVATGPKETAGPSNRTKVGKKIAKADLETWFVNRDAASNGIIVPMQTQASGTPVFAVPGADGSVMSLQSLSRAMDGIRPMFGFQAVGLDGKREPLRTIAEMADANIKALASMHDRSRLSLLGHSNGAVVAFEMARKLLKKNVVIERLVLVDCRCPALPARKVGDEISEAFVNLISALGGDESLDVEAFGKVPEVDRSEYLYELIRRNGFETPKPQFLLAYRLSMANEKACRAYRPQKITQACQTIVIRAMQANGEEPADLGWNKFLAKRATTVDIDASHLSVIGAEGSATIAKLFE